MPAAAIALQDRRTWLGGSDAAAVMGLSPWATPVELWMQKTGRAPVAPPSPDQARRFARGHKLEPFIREMVIEKLQDAGVSVDLLACNARFHDPEHHWMSCEIDFELLLTGEVLIGDRSFHLDREHVTADAKSVSGFARKKWGAENTEDVPIEYAAQFMYGLMLTGRRLCLVAALSSFDDVDIYWVVRDDETIAAMRPKLVSFWIDHVLADVPPDPLVYSDIKALFPLDNGDPIDADDATMAALARLRDVKRQVKNLKEIETELEFQLVNFIRPHALLLHKGRQVASWKAQQTVSIDDSAFRIKHPAIAAEFTRTSTTRVLRLAKPANSRF